MRLSNVISCRSDPIVLYNQRCDIKTATRSRCRSDPIVLYNQNAYLCRDLGLENSMGLMLRDQDVLSLNI